MIDRRLKTKTYDISDKVFMSGGRPVVLDKGSELEVEVEGGVDQDLARHLLFMYLAPEEKLKDVKNIVFLSGDGDYEKVLLLGATYDKDVHILAEDDALPRDRVAKKLLGALRLRDSEDNVISLDSVFDEVVRETPSPPRARMDAQAGGGGDVGSPPRTPPRARAVVAQAGGGIGAPPGLVVPVARRFGFQIPAGRVVQDADGQPVHRLENGIVYSIMADRQYISIYAGEEEIGGIRCWGGRGRGKLADMEVGPQGIVLRNVCKNSGLMGGPVDAENGTVLFPGMSLFARGTCYGEVYNFPVFRVCVWRNV